MKKRSKKRQTRLPIDPVWFKDAVIYELHVRSFCDSDGNGIGDFTGLISKLDYLQDLGVTALWLLPFYPSPLRDDGYDIADYTSVNPIYGDVGDFKRLVTEAHRRDLRIITELVINHTSTEHPWFQRARKAAPGSELRDFYVWSDTPERYAEARIIFKDFETSNWTWDPVAKAYYWHRFYSHQPDLNFDNPRVKKAVFKVLDFWMDMGVDGMRLDAVPYIFEREGTNCENLAPTHAYLKELRAHVDHRHPGRMLLAEANQWPEDAAAYFGDGDECHMNFHFPLMPRMFMALQLENNFPILDILEQTPAIPDNCQWAVFLRNHDELTLEMVTDEDRDYMNRMYAEDPQMRINLGIRRRLAPLLRSRPKIELMNMLLFSLPGTPVLYYGDEIAMGDNVYLGDRNGVRTPMQWTGDRNAGFSQANPQRLFLPVITDPEYHYEASNVQAQQHNPSSLLWWMKRLIGLRKQHPVFGRGNVEFVRTENSKIVAFVRHLEAAEADGAGGDQRVLVVANLSRHAQFAELDLAPYSGLVPTEMFGKSPFPVIGTAPYGLSLLPHGCFWFELQQPESAESTSEPAQVPRLAPASSLEQLFEGGRLKPLQKALRSYLGRQRWFRSKSRKQKALELVDRIPVPLPGDSALVLVLRSTYLDGTAEDYVLPLALLRGEQARAAAADRPHGLVARLAPAEADKDSGEAENGVLVDALTTPEFAASLLAMFGRKKVLRGEHGKVQIASYKALRALRGPGDDDDALTPRMVGVEQSNTSVVYGERLVLKMFRKLEAGTNPDLEMSRFLSVDRSFSHVPAVAGALEYEDKANKARSTLAILQAFAPNQGDAWSSTLEELQRTYEEVLSRREQLGHPPAVEGALLDTISEPIPEQVSELIGPFGSLVALLGQRTAEMHLALASGEEKPFAPEPFTSHYQQGLYQAARGRLAKTVQLLRAQLPKLADESKHIAQHLLERRSDIEAQAKGIAAHKIVASRIRCHGDYHLGQVLYTGKDYIIIDFEGEPGRALSERSFKTSALRDVAGMLRSFHYAAAWGLDHRLGMLRAEDRAGLLPWAALWCRHVSAGFLRAYLQTAAGAPIVPATWEQLSTLLNYYLLDKCMYELEYELNNRPNWAGIPLRGLVELVNAGRLTQRSGPVSL